MAVADADSSSSEWYDDCISLSVSVPVPSVTNVVVSGVDRASVAPSAVGADDCWLLELIGHPPLPLPQPSVHLRPLVPVPIVVVAGVDRASAAPTAVHLRPLVPVPSVVVSGVDRAYTAPTAVGADDSTLELIGRPWPPLPQPSVVTTSPRGASSPRGSSSGSGLQAFLYPALQPRRSDSVLHGILYSPLRSRSRSPVLQPVLEASRSLPVLPILLPVLEASRSSTTPALQDLGQVAVARASADAADARIRAGWWHGLVPNGIRRSIGLERDIFLRFPCDEPQDLAEYRQHCEPEIRAIASCRYFYLGITDNPAHRWQQHTRSGSGFSTMFVLAVAETSRSTGQLEQHCIARFRNPFMCGNIGAGAECSSYGSPHFFYIVFRSDALMRRAPTSGRGRVRLGRVEDDLYGPNRL